MFTRKSTKRHENLLVGDNTIVVLRSLNLGYYYWVLNEYIKFKRPINQHRLSVPCFHAMFRRNGALKSLQKREATCAPFFCVFRVLKIHTLPTLNLPTWPCLHLHRKTRIFAQSLRSIFPQGLAYIYIEKHVDIIKQV